MNNLIVNADDLGMTPGTNKAIFRGYDEGIITHVSIISNSDFFQDAINGLKKRPNLNVGIHLNLTYGKSLKSNQLLTDKDNIFNHGYIYLMLLSQNNSAFIKAIKEEFEAQILYVLDKNILLTHIDSHRHIHLIPSIYKIVIDLAKKYKIKKVRLVNENFFTSIRLTGKFNFILNGGLVKFILLKLFTYINRKNKDLYNDISFFSILYTGAISKNILNKLNKQGKVFEIMVHPNIIKCDKEISFYNINEKKYRLSQDREKELFAVLEFKK